jgi:dipeptidyl aminopeptidase/acylaminoacyl peptidase
VQSAAISSDGKILAMWPASPDKQGLTVRVASPPESQPKPYQPMPFQGTQWYNNPSLAFSPDGKFILLFAALDTRGETAWLLPWPPARGGRAFVDGLPVSNTPQFSWMPDSERVIFSHVTPTRHSSLYMGDARSGRHWPVLVQDRPANQPTLSPDGKRVAYTSQLSHADIIAVPLGDGPVRTLLGSTRDEERVDASRISPQLVYVTNRRGAPEVWLKSLSEGWERPILTPDDILTDGRPADGFMNPVFSADGRRIAVGVKSRSGTHVYTLFVSGGTPVRATSSQDLEPSATWSPDGNWLAVSTMVGSSFELVKVRPGSGEQPTVVSQTFGRAVPVWSPSGEWIADHDPDEHLVLVSLDGRSKRVLPGDRGPVAWSRDGKTLYQVRLDKPALYAIDIASGSEKKLRDLPDLAPFSNGSPGLSAALTLDEKSIVYTVQRPRSEIWILDGVKLPLPWYRR